MLKKVGLLSTHPIQYYVPWYRELAKSVDLQVYFADNQTASGQASAGFNVQFVWDIPLLDGYKYKILKNIASSKNCSAFLGCNTPQISEIIRHEKFDAFIIHGWGSRCYWQAMRACWKTKTPILVRGDSQLNTSRSSLKLLLKFFLYRWFIPKFSGYLVVGERAKQYYLHYGAKRTDLFFAPHAVNNEFFYKKALESQKNRDQIRNNLHIPLDAIVLIFAAKFIQKKNPLDFVEAVARISKNDSKVWGLMVGDGPLKKSVEMVVAENNLPIRFAGFLNQTEIPSAYAASDILILPSNAGETWGLVVNEAMASGLPAIVSDQVGCAPDLIKIGETGYTFPCGDIDQLVHCIQKMLMDDTLAQMKTNAQNYIKGYSIEQAVDGTIKAIKACTAS